MAEGGTFDPIQVLNSLPEECQRLCKAILTRNDPMASSTSAKLKDVLRRYEEELEAFGLIPDYYAYALIYVWPLYQQQQAGLN